MTTIQYDFSTAEAACNDNDNGSDTWEVRAKGTDGNWWTASDSASLCHSEAVWQAEQMRKDAAQC